MKARCNPFASDRVLKIRYKLDASEWGDLFCCFGELGYRAAIVGPKGSGKTTLLEDFAHRVEAVGLEPVFWRQNYKQRQPGYRELRDFFVCIGKQHLLCVDSAELLSWLSWYQIAKLSRQAGGLLVTLHQEGKLPTLIRCGTTPSLLQTILKELLPEESQPTEKVVEALFYKNEGNIRDALRECYFRYAADETFAVN